MSVCREILAQKPVSLQTDSEQHLTPKVHPHPLGRATSAFVKPLRMGEQVQQQFGNFEILKELGKGATGTVYLARQSNLGRECALKVLAPELVRDEKFLERFLREGQIAASLRHPNIVRIFDLVTHEGSYAIAMDYIEGVELASLLSAGEPFSVTRAVTTIIPVLKALDYAHQKGVVHRDIKPANIMMETDGDVFLTDFSIARLAGGEKLTQTGTIIGTPEYMAPEQFDGTEVDARADLYAATLVFYEMLAGINPFRGETLAEVVKKQVLTKPPLLRSLVDIPESLEKIVAKGLDKIPDERIQSAGELLEILEHFLTQNSTNLIQPPPQTMGLGHFLSSVEQGEISMDEAIQAREKVKEAIDRGFKRRLSIVMLDLAGSSKIKIPNQTLIADRAFRDYRATINQILEEQECEQYDWSGDGAIALFTCPIQAVTAAVRVQRTVSSVGERHIDLPDSLLVRIGIRTGMVYHDPRRGLGEFASRTVDQAGHLEKDCPPGQIHIGEDTAAAVSKFFVSHPIGKNRDDIEVFQIDLEKSMAKPASPPPPVQAPVSPAIPDLKRLRIQADQEPEERFETNKISAGVVQNSAPLVEALEEPSQSPPEKQESKKLFVPKETQAKPVSSPIESPTPESKDQIRWWGWRSLSVLFIPTWLALLAGIDGLLSDLMSGPFLAHMLLTPVYSIYAFITGKRSWARQSAAAFCVFFAALCFLIASEM